MKKIFLIFCLFLIVAAFFAFKFLNKSSKESISLPNIIPAVSSTPPPSKQAKVLFIPYWTLSNEKIDSSYDSLVYFGISANESGINKDESGYKNIGKFLEQTNREKENLIALRMINTDTNSVILKDQKLQEKIINETIDTAQNNFFRGIVLDFEINALPFESMVKKINSLYKTYSLAVKSKNLKLYCTIYGDSYYRGRPFDLVEISKNCDGVFIMAYDFYKAKGDPGPNFPLDGKEMYGYDFKSMITDFSKDVPKDKIYVIFGLYGYDWTVDEKNQSIEQANALTLNQIKGKFLEKCSYKDCSVTRDSKSYETEIKYKDNEGKSHIIWFEDMESVNKKIEFLKENGINKIIFWAYSYF